MYYEEFFRPGPSLATTTWFRKYFVEFVSETGGLIVSVLSFASVIMRGYEEFNSKNRMIRTLFHDSSTKRYNPNKEKKLDHEKAKDRVQKHLSSTKKLKVNFCGYLTAMMMPYLCFFLHYPLLKTNCYKRYVTKYKKLEEAKIRLADEQDVVHLIELSRVSRLLKKVEFKTH